MEQIVKFDEHGDGVITGELVRCGECEYYLQSDEECGLIDTRLHFYETAKIWTKDSFCSWGERKVQE
jgi:hypothetical protein